MGVRKQDIDDYVFYKLTTTKKCNRARKSQSSYLIRKWFGFKYLYRMWQRIFLQKCNVFVRTDQREDSTDESFLIRRSDGRCWLSGSRREPGEETSGCPCNPYPEGLLQLKPASAATVPLTCTPKASPGGQRAPARTLGSQKGLLTTADGATPEQLGRHEALG